MSSFSFSVNSSFPRNTFSLNGTWELAGGSAETIPQSFSYVVQVPALVDAATPKYDWQANDYHWYRTFFSIQDRKARSVFLSIQQSMFGTEVWLNGHHLGGTISCYTSHEYKLDEFLRFDEPNELLVRVGAKYTLPPESAVGRDQEKEFFIPGIWGDVELRCVGVVRVKTVQVIPHIATAIAEVRVILENCTKLNQNVTINATVVERKSHTKISQTQGQELGFIGEQQQKLIFQLPIEQMQLWSPENPFLYEVEITIARPSPTPSRREGVFGYQTADRKLYPILETFAKEHRKNPTQAEMLLWERLKTKSIEKFKFRRQHIIGKYIADFVCLSKNLVVEIDGLIHQLPENKEADEIRTQWLEEQGYKVIRFTNDEVIKTIDTVLSKIVEYLKRTKILPFGEDLGGAHLLDVSSTTFGMREFKIIGPDFYLNGNKIFLRGSNIAFHRFLSDKQRKLLPWNEEWIKKVLIDIPKEHHFNFFRNHIGQMYNKWYDIADEYGMLIQNEWMFWCTTGSKEQIIKEFSEWLHDNWNHPSIIIWDPLNESTDDVVQYEIIPEMKKLDPTRPWESVDFKEEHPYIYSLGMVLNDRKFGFTRALSEIEHSRQPSMINEFLWWWINSDGEPTQLTQEVVERWIGRNYSTEDLLQHQAFLAGELIELFRRMRVRAIQPFPYLGTSDGATAHWFLGDVADLNKMPIFKTLKNTFAPFGVSIELWDRHFFTNEQRTIRIFVFNDEPKKKTGTLRYGCSSSDGRFLSSETVHVEVDASGTTIVDATVLFPSATGSYFVTAELSENGKVVATSKKVSHVCAPVSFSKNIRQKNIVALDTTNEIQKYLSQEKVEYKSFSSEALTACTHVVVHGNICMHALYQNYLKEISQFVEQGGTLLLLEPEYKVVGNVVVRIADGIELTITQRADVDKGGYDSYIFAEDQTHALWNGISKEHLKMFNGAYGGEVVSQYDVLPNVPHAVLASSGLQLKVKAVYEISRGRGKIIVSRLQVRGRLLGSPGSENLFARRVDPVAQQYLVNLLSLQ